MIFEKKNNCKRILFLTDTHIVLKNPNNRIRMIDEGIELIDRITEVTSEIGADIVIHLGDLYDRGYSNVPFTAYNKQIKAMLRLSKVVNDNLFMLFGNHPWSFSKDNTEFSITEFLDNSLIELYKEKNRPELLQVVWRCPAYIDIGKTRIAFIHFNPNKNYKVVSDKPYTIGLYHDDFISFESKQELYHHRIGHGIKIDKTDVFDPVNTAILGHIHTPLNDIYLENFRNTRIINPGSLVNRTSAEKHSYVDLPVIDIPEDDEILDNGNNLPYLIQKYRFDLPKFEESFDLDKVKENRKMHDISKLLKKVKVDSGNIQGFENFLDSLSNTEISYYIRNAEALDELKSEIEFNEYKRRYQF